LTGRTGVPVRSIPLGEIRRLGDDALLVGVANAATARRMAGAIAAADLPGVSEVVGGQATVMVAFADPEEDALEQCRVTLSALMATATDGPDDEGGGEARLEIPCSFDGPDLAEVAEAAGFTVASVIEMLTTATLTVEMVGFSPGFAYLAGLPAALADLPRRAQPRPAVPAGSVALANGYAAVYPTASPGGWQLVGHTDLPLFNPLAPPYARLAPGHRVRFVATAGPPGADASSRVRNERSTGAGDLAWTAPATARRVFVVEEAGLRTVLQDGGRRGVAAVGVPAAGPADPASFRLANAVVGNPPEAGALEITARGPTLRCLRSTFVAVVGASPEVRLEGQPVEADRVVPVNAGQVLVVGPLHRGLRTYLAVAGGLAGPEMLGSCASDQLSGLGPGPLRRGAEIWAGPLRPPLGDHLAAGSSTRVEPDEPVALRVVPGPHHEMFAAGTMASLASMRFTVGDESNRVGVRLQPDPSTPPLERGVGGALVELDSQGMVTGAVQVPPDGQPVILLTDHATLGGYPVVAVVVVADLGLLGQCAPGAQVVLVPIDHATAAEARRHQRRRHEAAVVGHYPLAAG
jgi:KipI family sensor histidine kinase inhibitor